MTYTVNEIADIINAEEQKGKPATYEYFTFIWYPLERQHLFEDKLIYNLGYWQFSPMHESENIQFYIDKVTQKIGKAPLKPHIHVICKASNKQTANAFIKRLCEVLGNDLTGVAISKEEIGVSKILDLLRYQLHLNNPYKEHFDVYEFLKDCPSYFWTEYARAFKMEIQKFVETYIDENECTEMIEVIKMIEDSCIISEWLNDRKHMLLCVNMLNDNKRRIKERERKEWTQRQR